MPKRRLSKLEAGQQKWFVLTCLSPLALLSGLFFGHSSQKFNSLYLIPLFCIFVFIAVRSMILNDRIKSVKMLILALALVIDFILLYALIYSDNDLIVSSSGDAITASDCLYFSVITWTTVGYGDIIPKPSARMIAASEAFVGYISMAILIAAALKVLDRFAREIAPSEEAN